MPVLAYTTNRMTMRWLRGIATPPPAGLFVGALRQMPSPDGSDVLEPAGGNYARQPITLSEESCVAGVTSTYNANAIVFPTASQDWPSVTHLGIFTDLGDLLVYGSLAAPRAIPLGDSLAFGESTIQLRLK
jgi:hypothetical protein